MASPSSLLPSWGKERRPSPPSSRNPHRPPRRACLVLLHRACLQGHPTCPTPCTVQEQHQLPVLLAAGQHVPLAGQQYSASDLLMVRALFSCFWVQFFKEKIKQLHGPKGNQGQLLRAASALQETFQNRTRYNNSDLLCHIHSVNSQHSRP